MRDRIFISKSKRSGSGFKHFLVLLVVFALGVFVGMKVSNLNIKIVKEEAKERAVNAQTEINDSQAKISDSETDNQEVANQLKPVITPTVSSSPEPPSPTVSPSPSPEPPKVMEYTLQLAAFKGREKAQEFVNELKEKGYYAYFVPVSNSKGETWNLIRVGKFKTRDEAQDFAALFQERERMEVLVKEVD